ncbi:MAG: TonB-dependent hemoglobin/transferrin/lactoferrin family receptor [Woeseiaceae bacterium]|nr:TonB-dependent hemoglobin/transferrin/lactoferrin family receptor [Woeseiaceae bacterium]
MLSTMLWLWAAAAAESATTQPSGPEPIDVITVEASKRPMATTELASRVTVIDQDRIERELVQDIADLVRYEPGVDVADQGSRFGFSGFSIRGIGGNRVRTEIDGVATSDAFSIGNFSNAGRDFIDVESIKQLEIIRGPGSAMFGSNAIGGVVSYVTKGPDDYLDGGDAYLDVNAGYNSVDSSAVAGLTGALRSGDVAAMLSVNTRNGGQRDNPFADPLDARSINILAKLQFGDVTRGGFGLTVDHFDAVSETDVASLEEVTDFTADFGFPYVIDRTDVAGDDERRRTRVSVGQEWLAGQFGTDYLRWRLFWQNSETHQDTYEAVDTFIAGRAGQLERERAFRFEQDLVGLEINALNDVDLFGIDNEIAYGLEYEAADTAQIRDGTQRDLLTGETTNRVAPDVYPVRDFPLSTSESLGIYVQDRISLGPVTLIPGLRWDRFELRPENDAVFAADNPGIEPVGIVDDQVSPKFGMLWDLTDNWQVYGQYAEGFRAPPVNDVNVGFTNFQFGYTALPNPDLRSERSRGYELGLRFAGERATAELAAFTTRYDDFIEPLQVVGFDPLQQLLIFQSVNVEEVEISGLEFQGRMTPAFLPAGMSLNLSGAYARGENLQTGAPINSVAPLNGVLGLEYANPEGRWGGRFLARAAAGVDDLDESAGALLQPAGYVVYDVIGYWRISDKLRLSGGVFNLTDHVYTAYLDVQGAPADITNPGRFQRPGRNVSLAIDWIF